jgi:hypothetical protein
MVLIMSCSSIARMGTTARRGGSGRSLQEQNRSELVQLNAEVRADLDKRGERSIAQKDQLTLILRVECLGVHRLATCSS